MGIVWVVLLELVAVFWEQFDGGAVSKVEIWVVMAVSEVGCDDTVAEQQQFLSMVS